MALSSVKELFEFCPADFTGRRERQGVHDDVMGLFVRVKEGKGLL